jgi:hypothetical protein
MPLGSRPGDQCCRVSCELNYPRLLYEMASPRLLVRSVDDDRPVVGEDALKNQGSVVDTDS